jgi:hypothetical protein
MKRNLSRLAFVLVIITASYVIGSSQTSGDRNAEAQATAPTAAESVNRTSANETFELNITERRITERDFQASTTVEAGEETARGLLLRVGVSVGADEINVLLRNVRGRVNFRATLERVLQRLNARHPAPGAAP